MMSILGSILIGVFLVVVQGSHATPSIRRATSCTSNIGYNVEAVANQAQRLASHSWEYGTAAEALLELYNPNLSVFGKNPFPGGHVPVVNWEAIKSLSYVKPFIQTDGQTLIDGDGKPPK